MREILLKMIKTLTKAEEQIMQVMWKLKTGFLKDFIDALPSPKPHSNTVATILKILADKKYISIEVIGRIHQYSVLVSKEEYTQNSIKTLVEGYFDGSVSSAISFMVDKNKLNVDDLELLLKQLKKQKK